MPPNASFVVTYSEWTGAGGVRGVGGRGSCNTFVSFSAGSAYNSCHIELFFIARPLFY